MIKVRGKFKNGKVFSTTVHAADIGAAGSFAFSALRDNGVAPTDVAEIKLTLVPDSATIKVSEPRKAKSESGASEATPARKSGAKK